MSTRLAQEWGVPAITLVAWLLVLVGLTHVNVLQVTDSKEQTPEVVRERLVGFVQREYPDSLPRIRASFAADPTERTQGYAAAERTA